jgi:hypothetical protein
VTPADLSFVPLANPAVADLDMARHSVNDAAQILVNENATPTAPPTNGLTLFTHGDKLQYVDDTSAVYVVATASDLSPYLLKSGGTMTGTIDMGTQYHHEYQLFI